MKKSRIITSFMWAFITNVSASSWLQQSDVANIKLPSPFVENGVRYTIPALQGMRSHNIDLDFVREVINMHLKELATATVLEVGGICMLFSKTGINSYNLTSIWKID